MKKVSRGELKELNAELLAEVFSFLPSQDLVEVMLVSKHWERSATEGSDSAWRKVTLALAWDMGGGGGKGHNFMCKVLAAAKEVDFKFTFRDNGHIESLGGVLGSNLRFLEIPRDSVSSAFLSILLSQCPNLRTLVMNGEPKGSDPIDIRHPQLETLKIECRKSRALTIDCPNLTHLSTGTSGNSNMPLPSIICPRLTDLVLSPIHCRVAIWELLASHAPNIKWLEVWCSEESPLSALTGFRVLQALRVRGKSKEIPPHFDFGQWPLLEGILLEDVRFPTDLEVRHAHLKELRIVEPVVHTSLILDCPSLEKLWLDDVTLAKNLDSQCPRLQSLKLRRRIMRAARDEEVLGLSEVTHEMVEELEFGHDFSPEIKRIACPKLTKLVLAREINVPSHFAFPVVECLSLLRLELHGCAHLVSDLPSILAVLPDLKSLEIGERWLDKCNYGYEDIVWEHSRIKDLVIEKNRARSLVLIMPSLAHVEIGTLYLRVLKVASMEKTIIVDLIPSSMLIHDRRRRRVIRGGGMRMVDLSDAL